MPSVKNMLSAAAGAGGDALNVENLFSTHLYTGNASSNAINNGIDLSGEGGMVWTKRRDAGISHAIYDTERGTSGTDALITNTNDDAVTGSMSSFNSNGFTLDSDSRSNASGDDMCSWTFRKAPRFFDVVTYTGNGTAGRTVSHSLGTTVGCIAVKRTDTSANWMVYHRGVNQRSNPHNFTLFFNNSVSQSDQTVWNDTAPTSSVFTVSNDDRLNANGGTYVAYLWAHNNNDGGFGPTADQDIIKCDFYEGNGSPTVGPEINLGFEPQFLMIKNSESTGNWLIFDNMRGITADDINDKYFLINEPDAEADTTDWIEPTANGFKVTNSNSAVNTDSQDYIYIAIRRGPMAVPESSSSVFAIETRGATSPNPPAFNASFNPDFSFRGVPSASFLAARKIQGGYVSTTSNAARTSSSSYSFDYQNGWWNNTTVSTSDFGYMWGIAPEFCDVVTYTGNGSNRTIAHNLTTQPDMFWIKRWNSTGVWAVWHTGLTGNNKYLRLDQAMAEIDFDLFNNTAPTSSNFSVGTNGNVNGSGSRYICMLFGSLSGVSKCGSYSGNGGTQNIDCGFSNGSKLVIIKSLSAGDSWHMYDTSRTNSLVAGNDTSYDLDTSTNYTADAIDPLSSGFTVNSTGNLTNSSGKTYIFYAIAA